MDNIAYPLVALCGVAALVFAVANGDYSSALVIVTGFATFFGLRRWRQHLGEEAWKKSRIPQGVKTSITVALIILVVISVIISPGGGSHVLPGYSKSSAAMQQARALYVLISDYADAHQGKYPTGSSSTEIFQKLVDENHMKPTGKSLKEVVRDLIDGPSDNDPSIFCLDMPGKTPASSVQLKPENVCFDVTVPLGKNSPDELPAVFVTGYKVTYVSSGTAIPLPASRERYWTAVCYNSGSAFALMKGHELPDWPSIEPDGTVVNFIPATFHPAGKKFEQLTPDGPLAP
jgi:type II secretory pathway pseudopilin PulG